MALAILPHAHTIPLDAEVCALARELHDEEGLPFRAALVLADMQMRELAAYAEAWDQWATARREAMIKRCPVCGGRIVGKQQYVGGRGYVWFDVCEGNGSHYGRKA